MRNKKLFPFASWDAEIKAKHQRTPRIIRMCNFSRSHLALFWKRLGDQLKAPWKLYNLETDPIVKSRSLEGRSHEVLCNYDKTSFQRRTSISLTLGMRTFEDWEQAVPKSL
ncbi:hypothetical protein MPTK1_6g15440 [Marchantia polymorpha subsp. ruderalis]|uniref:Uncharacterized protein n=2 Tax=Marchantia polymorpha TaxID=3197 RepID=A0AAF6BSB8_MARPO|nr:hypothetical protein MARPO_0056s0056 [Marchantia polymorpha]PTQ37587.1 hypothetical protein MARPO_0056s0056 [Marchantia polymorpha]BBN14902.1 hypothetical protein Mp_6g15440 [Marchantia polymorpha subsp. ruderalis]BBN14903.1 hypothetical protein Mp_6g15440 [Marchantia polymorpha subsp. ruderalis]|eukprot:PTQ37586.1 hypothetical protein MARPO_0056s0056 [Marchantia polymorpha]